MLSLHELLNPISPTPHHQLQSRRSTTPNLLASPNRTNIEPHPQVLSSPPSLQHERLATPHRRNHVNLTTPTVSSHGVLSLSRSENALLSTTHNVRLNSKTMMSALYHYKTGTVLEYPHTSDTPTTAVGHLFELSPSEWNHPRLSFAYSQGSPKGRSPEGSHHYCSLLKNDETGEEVPCRELHYTCTPLLFINHHTFTF